MICRATIWAKSSRQSYGSNTASPADTPIRRRSPFVALVQLFPQRSALRPPSIPGQTGPLSVAEGLSGLHWSYLVPVITLQQEAGPLGPASLIALRVSTSSAPVRRTRWIAPRSAPLVLVLITV